MIPRLAPLFALFAFVLVAPDAVRAAPAAELWPRWQAHDAASTERVDHGAWDRFLAKYLVVRPEGANRVRYDDVSAADRAVLDGYLAMLSRTDVSALDRPEQLAFWINLYNALTVRVILDHWPVRSIRDIDISPGFFSDGPWGKTLIAVAGENLSLDDIEHRILRPIWRDPRIHYAVNCASIGCPDLARRAYTADNAEAMLDEGARNYVNSARGARLDGDGRLIVSSIYDWFTPDFGGSEAAVLDHLRRYADEDLRSRLSGRRDIDGYVYDWTVNAAP